ncbi:hypothetical protein QWZ08_26955 [Ferruginibacter paludis]|uniref:hypothetical protein n=1 Tax=Ferruginibacter paludis TaxID=1310417 RepID=UPI0025B51149|nr:hypothetical protein [Ferruginibacter paludis]MDN3659314.1 hypothetical protein [Ferruginibacter paludis]
MIELIMRFQKSTIACLPLLKSISFPLVSFCGSLAERSVTNIYSPSFSFFLSGYFWFSVSTKGWFE